jgi:hypothetical protein
LPAIVLTFSTRSGSLRETSRAIGTWLVADHEMNPLSGYVLRRFVGLAARPFHTAPPPVAATGARRSAAGEPFAGSGVRPLAAR